MQIQKRNRYRVMKNGGTNPDTVTGTAEEYEDLPDEDKTTMLPSAVIEGDFVPQDIPEGYDPYINNSTEQKIFDKLPFLLEIHHLIYRRVVLLHMVLHLM